MEYTTTTQHLTTTTKLQPMDANRNGSFYTCTDRPTLLLCLLRILAASKAASMLSARRLLTVCSHLASALLLAMPPRFSQYTKSVTTSSCMHQSQLNLCFFEMTGVWPTAFMDGLD